MIVPSPYTTAITPLQVANNRLFDAVVFRELRYYNVRLRHPVLSWCRYPKSY